MSTPNPQDPHISSQHVEQEGQEQDKLQEENPSSTDQKESPTSENLDLEKMMDEAEVKSTHSSNSAKEP